MNAAAKAIHQSNLFSGQFGDIRISKVFFLQILLTMALLFSALAVIYTTNLHRVTLSQLQSSEQIAHELQLQWGQYLLEQASLSTPARVQRLADQKLHMIQPLDKQTYLLHAQ